MKTIAILGSTGSIGRSTLRIATEHSGRFSVGALAAGRNWRLLAEQIREFRPHLAAVLDDEVARDLKVALGRGTPTDIVTGERGYGQVAELSDCQIVVSAMVGAAGLRPTIAAIAAGKTLALANKESLVIGGALVTRLAREKGVRILPVDSEHSAIFQCLEAHAVGVRRILLTASGGPFRSRPAGELARVTPEEALRHPNWTMGAKISVDSATMMNKGLEMIEARWLFDIEMARVQVVIHPQSVVHSLVEFVDGSLLAQLCEPNMRLPIQYALTYPERLPNTLPSADFVKMARMDFEMPDHDRFPALRLAREAGERGGTAPAVFNAANEVAVDRFVKGEIRFPDIWGIVESALARHRLVEHASLEEILAADRWAREISRVWKGG